MDDPANPDLVAERLADALASFHEDLVRGVLPETPHGLDATIDVELAADQRCLELIERVRRRHGEALLELLHHVRRSQLPPPDNLPAFKTIGRFQIIDAVARGGHGVILLAHDPIVGRDVALKVPRAESLFDPEMRARFLCEAQAAGRLTHPNIVPVFEVQQVGPVCYIASEYCRGPTLRQWIADQVQPVSPRVASRIVLDLAAAVTYAHSQGVLHRDLKPSNVLLDTPPENAATATEGTGLEEFRFIPKLTDFGLAKLLESTDHITRSGMLMGTPAYMAPEQAAGRRGEVGPQTDVYALGTILYELLSGSPPFEGASDVDTVRRVVSDEPKPLRQTRRDVPRDLEAIALKCLQKEPTRRYQTADELAADLRRWLNGAPIKARPVSRVGIALRWARRNPLIASSAVVIAALLVAMAIGGTLVAVLIARSRNDAERATVKAQQAADERRHSLYAAQLALAQQAIGRHDLATAGALLRSHIPSSGETDLRSFEWYYLWGQTHQELNTLRRTEIGENIGGVSDIALSADDRLLAGAYSDGTVVIWDLASHSQIIKIQGSGEPIGSIAINHDASLFATAGLDRKVRLFDVSGSEVTVLVGHQGPFSALAFSPDGRLLVSAAGMNDTTIPEFVVKRLNGELKVWNVETEDMRFELKGHDGPVTDVAFSPDGETIASVGWDGTLRLWSARTGKELSVHKKQSLPTKLMGVAFAPDGKKVATAGWNCGVTVWDLESGKAESPIPVSSVLSVAFAPDGRTLATGNNNDSLIQTWELSSGKQLATMTGHTSAVQSLAFRRDGVTVVSGSEDGTIRLWDTRESHIQPKLVGHSNEIRGLEFLPDGRAIASAASDGTWRLWDVATATMLFQVQALDGRVVALDVSSDGQLVGTGGMDDSMAKLWDARTGDLRRSIPHDGAVMSIKFAPDSRLVATTTSDDGSLYLWDTTTGDSRAAVTAHSDGAYGIAFAPSGQIIATGGADEKVRIWSVPHLRQVASLDCSDPVFSLAFSPNGKVLVAGTWRRKKASNEPVEVTLWTTASWQELRTIRAHKTCVPHVGFSPDGKTLVTTGGWGTVKLWDPTTGDMRLSFEMPLPGWVHRAVFSPNGRTLACVSAALDRPSDVLLFNAASVDE